MYALGSGPGWGSVFLTSVKSAHLSVELTTGGFQSSCKRIILKSDLNTSRKFKVNRSTNILHDFLVFDICIGYITRGYCRDSRIMALVGNNERRLSGKADWMYSIQPDESGYQESIDDDVMDDCTTRVRIHFEPRPQFLFSMSDFQRSCEYKPKAATKALERSTELCASIRIEDSDFASNFTQQKYQQKYPNYNFSLIELPRKITVIGDANTGKTSFVRRYVSRRYSDEYAWTIGGKSEKLE